MALNKSRKGKVTAPSPEVEESSQRKVARLVLTSPYVLTHPVTGQRLTPNEPFKHEVDAWLTEMMQLGHIVEDAE